MTTTRSRAEIGRANNRKGKDAEQRVARYLREHGWPNAERHVRTGYRTAGRALVDPLDITGTPGIVWSVKADTSAQVRSWLHETEQVRRYQGADLGVLVVRRSGKASPARWWAWAPFGVLIQLTTGRLPHAAHQAPVCLELGELLPMLWAAGYGSEEDVP